MGTNSNQNLQSSGVTSQIDFTKSESQSCSAQSCSADSCYELSYTSLKMASDKGAKRQKRTDSMEFGAMFDRSLEELGEKDSLDGTYEHAGELDFTRA